MTASRPSDRPLRRLGARLVGARPGRVRAAVHGRRALRGPADHRAAAAARTRSPAVPRPSGAAFPDVRLNPTGPRLSDGTHASAPAKLIGTHRRPLEGLAATHRPLELHVVFFAELHGERFFRIRAFFDAYGAAVALGVLPAAGDAGGEGAADAPGVRDPLRLGRGPRRATASASWSLSGAVTIRSASPSASQPRAKTWSTWWPGDVGQPGVARLRLVEVAAEDQRAVARPRRARWRGTAAGRPAPARTDASSRAGSPPSRARPPARARASSAARASSSARACGAAGSRGRGRASRCSRRRSRSAGPGCGR